MLPRLPRRLFLKTTAAATTICSLSSRSRATADTDVFIDESSTAVTIGNSRLEIIIRKDNGGIEQMTTREHGVDLRDREADTDATLWRLSFYDPGSRTMSSIASAPDISTYLEERSATVSLTWSRPRTTGDAVERFDGSVTVDVTVGAGDELAKWQLSITNESDLVVREAICPFITAIQPPVDDGSDAIIYPWLLGRRIENPTALNRGIGNLYPMSFMNMQFTGYSGVNSILFVQAEDNAGYQKLLIWEPEPDIDDRLRLRHIYFHPRKEDSSPGPPYTVATGWLEGDWYDAADRYRSWVDTHGWLGNDPSGPPSWIQDTAVTQMVRSYPWQKRRGFPQTYDETLDTIQQWRENISVENYQVVWKNWRAPEASRPIPEEGEEAFRSAISRLTDEGISVVSHETPKWIKSTGSFFHNHRDSVLDWVLRRANTEPWTREFDADQTQIGEPMTLYQADFTVPARQRQLRQWYNKIVSMGVAEVKLDGFPAFWPPCFSGRHDHPPGHGGWFSQRSRQKLQQMKATLQDEQSDIVFSGEGIADYYLPLLDVHHTRGPIAESRYRERFPWDQTEVIPLFSYTYSDLVVPRAEGIDARGDLETEDGNYVRLAIGRTVEWGAIPQLFAPGEHDIDALPNPARRGLYLGRVGRARETYANRFIARGVMLRKPVYEAPEITMRDMFTSPEGEREFEYIGPAIKASAWRSRSDTVGLMFTNIAPDGGPRQATVDLSTQPFKLPAEPWLVYAVTNGTYDRLDAEGDQPRQVTLELDQMDVALLVIEPAEEGRKTALQAILDAQEGVEGGHDATNLLQESKRAFERGDTSEAIDKAKGAIAAVETPTPSATATEATPTPELNTPTSTEPTTTAADAPGFTAVTAIVGALFGMISRRLLNSDNGTNRQDNQQN